MQPDPLSTGVPARGILLDRLKLGRAIAVRGVNLDAFAQEAGVHAQTLAAALRGRPVSRTSARRIALAMDRVPVIVGLAELVAS